MAAKQSVWSEMRNVGLWQDQVGNFLGTAVWGIEGMGSVHRF